MHSAAAWAVCLWTTAAAGVSGNAARVLVVVCSEFSECCGAGVGTAPHKVSVSVDAGRVLPVCELSGGAHKVSRLQVGDFLSKVPAQASHHHQEVSEGGVVLLAAVCRVVLWRVCLIVAVCAGGQRTSNHLHTQASGVAGLAQVSTRRAKGQACWHTTLQARRVCLM